MAGKSKAISNASRVSTAGTPTAALRLFARVGHASSETQQNATALKPKYRDTDMDSFIGYSAAFWSPLLHLFCEILREFDADKEKAASPSLRGGSRFSHVCV
jgi:siderophore synthetase component